MSNFAVKFQMTANVRKYVWMSLISKKRGFQRDPNFSELFHNSSLIFNNISGGETQNVIASVLSVI